MSHAESISFAWTPRRSATSTRDRKSTRLNSSHGYISYAVFCLKKKKTNTNIANVINIRIANKLHLTIIELNTLHTITQIHYQTLDEIHSMHMTTTRSRTHNRCH